MGPLWNKHYLEVDEETEKERGGGGGGGGGRVVVQDIWGIGAGMHQANTSKTADSNHK